MIDIEEGEADESVALISISVVPMCVKGLLNDFCVSYWFFYKDLVLKCCIAD